MRQHEVEKSRLEVITKNIPAIKSYQSIGFEICRNYKCFSGDINIETPEVFELQEVHTKQIDWEQLPNQQFYSWDHQRESILQGNYRFFQVLNNNIPESYFIIKPDSGYLAQFDLLHSNKHGWNRLFSAIKHLSGNIKINNVDERLTKKLAYLNTIKLENIIDQYEMELNIKDGC